MAPAHAPLPGRPCIDVVGLGPAGPDLVTAGALALIERAPVVLLRTGRHPSASVAPDAGTFDDRYEAAETFEEVYAGIAGALVDRARSDGHVVYAVPGSPSVAERTVVLLAAHPAVASGEVDVVVHPAVSFLDLALARLGVDPVAAGMRLVDGERFSVEAAGERGPLLVAQCWSRDVLSAVKLAVEEPPAGTVTLLHHLGLPDEVVREVAWEDLDRTLEPDHLTSLWIPVLAAPVAGELVALDELVRTLRERCPWDQRQTHASLARHLLEESHEVLEAIEAVAAADAAMSGGTHGSVGAPAADLDAAADAVAHLEEELGDLLFQVYFHAALAAEAGRFTLADVARGVHDKLVSRHPHVFGDVTAETADDVAANWEALKRAEKGRTSVTEGIPASLPALALAAKLQRKAAAVGMVLPSLAEEAERVAGGVAGLAARPVPSSGDALGTVADGEGAPAPLAAEVGALLFDLVGVARSLGVDPETALLARARSYRDEIDRHG